jgi:hypothetical protein
LKFYRLPRFASNPGYFKHAGWVEQKRPAFLPSLESDTHPSQFCEDEDDGFREGLNPSLLRALEVTKSGDN